MKNSKYIFTIFLIILSMVATTLYASVMGKDEVLLSSSDETIIEKNSKDKKEGKNKKTKKKFQRNSAIDDLIVKVAAGKSADEVGEKLTEEIKVAGKLKDGVYTGSAQGYEGAVTVEVKVEGGKIVSLRVLSHSETPGYYELGFKVIDRILAAQSVNVDTVSGATVTSRAIMIATARALKNAVAEGEQVDAFSEEDLKEQVVTKERDVPINPGAYGKESYIDNINIDLSSIPDGTYTGEAMGFNGTNKVTLTVEGGKIVNVIVRHGDDAQYFTEYKKNKLIEAIKKDINIRSSRDVDSISGATYSSNSIIRAAKFALSKYKTSGYSILKVIDGVHITRNNEKNIDYMVVEKHAPIHLTLDGVTQKTTSLDTKQYIRLTGYNKNTNVTIKNMYGEILFDSKVEGDFVRTTDKINLEEYNNAENKVETKTIDDLNIYGGNLKNFKIKRSENKIREGRSIENSSIISYDIASDDIPVLIEMPEKDYNRIFRFTNSKGEKLLHSYVIGNKRFLLSKGSGHLDIIRGESKKEALTKLIKFWREENLDYPYFVLPPDLDSIYKDGDYIGYGYGYKADSDSDRWKTKVVIKGGKITEIKLLNQPDDGEYVVLSRNFQNKLQTSLYKDVNKLIALDVELEKFYSLEPTVINKFPGMLPLLDDQPYLKEVKENISSIEPDAVTGATISTVGMTRSVMDALNKAINGGDDVITPEPEKPKPDPQPIPKPDPEPKPEPEKPDPKPENPEPVSPTPKPEEPDSTKYVANIVGDYHTRIFVRPPEVGAKLYDGEYIGHGRGYYYDTDRSVNSYVRMTKVLIRVKDGKVADVEALHFGDDEDGGGIGYKAAAEKFRVKAFDLVKRNTDEFIKQHIDIERYIAALYTDKFYPMFKGDTKEKVRSELGKKMTDADVVSGATYSSAGYSRAIAEALYKASLNKKVINDMTLNDFDMESRLQLNSQEYNAYFGIRYEKRRQERIDKKLLQTHYYPGEKFDPTNLILTVSYSDGTKENLTFDQLASKGFKVEIYNQKQNKIYDNVLDYLFEFNYYKQLLKIYRTDTDKNINSEFVNGQVYSNSRKKE